MPHFATRLWARALESRLAPATFTVMNLNDAGANSLRDCVAQANANAGADTIDFQSGLTGTITLLSGELLPNQAVTIIGPGSSKLTVDGNLSGRVFNFSPLPAGGKVAITGLTISKGNVGGSGGGVFVGDEVVTLTDCVVTGNKASSRGGGIYLQTPSASLTMTNCLVTNNSASFAGGGIGTANTGGTVNILSSTISNNTASYGGGMNGFATTISIHSSSIVTNKANLHGGGFYLSAGSFLLENSTVSGNTAAGNGGGMFLDPVSGPGDRIRNSTISSNQSGNSGGGIGIERGTVTIENSTIVLNNATGGAGGGIARRNGPVVTISVESSIVSGNINASAPDISSTQTVNLKTSAIGSGSGFTPTNLGGNLTYGVNLKLGSLTSNGGPTLTHFPAADSPLINAGSNPASLTMDQRGRPRINGGLPDIGSVEFDAAQVASIVRASPTPTSAVTVPWAVTFSDPVIGLSAGNFMLSGVGAAGASIASVTGGGANWTVSANTGADGALRLDMVNDSGLDRIISNLPFQGETYTVDRTTPTVSLTANPTMLNASKAGLNALALTATFSEPMDQAISPILGFPVENPGAGLIFAGGSWTSSTTFAAKYNLFDFDDEVFSIDVEIMGGKDVAGNLQAKTVAANLFSIDTANPVVVMIDRNDPNPTKAASVAWTVTFTEAITGLSATNLLLFNGGLGGSPAITGVTGGGTSWTVTASTGTGQGNLALYVLKTTGMTDAAGNPVAALPVLGPAYSVDHIAPQAAKLTTNTLTVNDFNIGPAGFQVTIEFNEPMNQAINPTVSFPVENPAPTLALAGGTWLDAKTYRATYSVADFGATLSDIDIAVSGGQDAVGNPQAPLTVNDLFDIDMASPTVSTIKVNGGTVQRSRVTTVEVAFDRHVTFSGTPETAIQLKRQSDGKLPTLAAAVDDTGPTTVVTLTFSGTSAVDFTSLADGRYTLTIFANQVTSGGGILDGDSNGVGGDNYVLVGDTINAPKLFRYFGDITGDGAVAADDFIQFRLALGGNSPVFDFDGDGAVAASDFIQFRLRFGGSI